MENHKKINYSFEIYIIYYIYKYFYIYYIKIFIILSQLNFIKFFMEN
jgi:hypothetical protein